MEQVGGIDELLEETQPDEQLSFNQLARNLVEKELAQLQLKGASSSRVIDMPGEGEQDHRQSDPAQKTTPATLSIT